MSPRRRILALTVILALTAGCAVRATHGGSGSRSPGLTIGSDLILVGKIPDGSGGDGVVPGSGPLMTQQVRKQLLAYHLKILPSEAETAEALFNEASAKRATYVLVGRIPRWEDNATKWSKKLDYTSVALELYRVSDHTLVASSDRNVQGVTTPEDWADWVADAAVSDLLGKPAPPW